MPQEFLHTTEISAVVQQMCRKTVPQDVRRKARLQAGTRRIFLDQPLHGPCRESPPVPIQEEAGGLTPPAQGHPEKSSFVHGCAKRAASRSRMCEALLSRVTSRKSAWPTCPTKSSGVPSVNALLGVPRPSMYEIADKRAASPPQFGGRVSVTLKS